MRIMDRESSRQLRGVALFLSTDEAKDLAAKLRRLLRNAHEDDHEHVFDTTGRRQISFEIITPKKIRELVKRGYHPSVRRILKNW